MSEMIYGIHAVQALLERAPERFQEVFILKGREDKRLLSFSARLLISSVADSYSSSVTRTETAGAI